MPETAEAAAPAVAPVAPVAPATPSVAPVTPGSQSESDGLSQKPPATESILGSERAASPAAPASYVNPDGSFVQDWTQKLPEDFADSRTSLARYKNVQDLARAYRHAEKMVSQKGIHPITPESSPEQVAEYRRALGVPDKPEAYAEAVKPNVEVPEGVVWDDGIAGEYFKLAHQENIKPESMQKLIQLNLKQREFELKAYNQQTQHKRDEGLHVLRRTWGANFDQNLKLAQNVARFHNVDPDNEGFNTEIVRMIVAMAKEQTEDKYVSGTSMPHGTGDFASQARDIQTNKDNQYYKRYWDGDPDIQTMVRNLHRKAASGR